MNDGKAPNKMKYTVTRMMRDKPILTRNRLTLVKKESTLMDESTLMNQVEYEGQLPIPPQLIQQQ